MKNIVAGDPGTCSMNAVAGNLDRLRALFPETFTEGQVDFDTLRQLLGDSVDDGEEKYGLSWRGKRRARQLALTPSTGTLRPCPEDSVDWDTTKNLIVEGDNLEVLKLLQKSYAGKVKMIYIDPPYNTGKDFVYPDDYRNSLRNYLELTGQAGRGATNMSSNTETSGRFHTNWLNMMYPRLRIARQFLRDDGIMIVSISDSEMHNLRQMLDEIFGVENFMACILWNSTKSVTNTALVSVSHTYNLIFARNIEYFVSNRSHFRLSERKSGFANPDNDPRGPWKADPFQVGGERPNQMYPIKNPNTGKIYRPNPGNSWKNELKKFQELLADGRIVFGTTGNAGPQRKRFLSEAEERGMVSTTWWNDLDTTTHATKSLKVLMGESVFDNPKPVSLVRKFMELGIHDAAESIVMDFYAGSGTTGQAVLEQNLLDRGSRRYVLIQLPEPLCTENRDQRIAAAYCDTLGKPRNIAELTKERLRRVAKKILEENPTFQGDLGFRAFKLDTSSIKAWDTRPVDLENALLSALDHIEPNRSECDILHELLLKLGLELCTPTETRTIAGKSVHSVGAGVLMACLSDSISREDVEPLAFGISSWHEALSPARESTVVFLDSAFADDVAKINLAETLKQCGLGNVRSL